MLSGTMISCLQMFIINLPFCWTQEYYSILFVQYQEQCRMMSNQIEGVNLDSLCPSSNRTLDMGKGIRSAEWNVAKSILISPQEKQYSMEKEKKSELFQTQWRKHIEKITIPPKQTPVYLAVSKGPTKEKKQKTGECLRGWQQPHNSLKTASCCQFIMKELWKKRYEKHSLHFCHWTRHWHKAQRNWILGYLLFNWFQLSFYVEWISVLG